ncbi:MAG TPA: nitric oxide reductase transcriptional regulator NorR [Moraxellaceae bacterium]|nr:nitric oxide reductase transcriptional regulator NorR [Moraxellaceae bacterium]
MIEESLLADLGSALPSHIRLQRLVRSLRAHFHCGAVALLRLQEDALLPVACDGLVHEALGRRFRVAHHPRLAAILARRQTTAFSPESELPDPYDGLLEGHEGAPLPVHDCMGISLHVEGEPWGVLTLDALSAGTFDEVARDALGRIALLTEAAIRVTRLEEEVRGLRESWSSSVPLSLAGPIEDELLGHSPAMQALLREIDVVADSDLPVLLLGETGTGKELLARRLHRCSLRKERPLVHVNCAALPESLAESELFGHSKGAFSGATSDRAGRFEAADGGTLFLDEVGELPLPVQAKLLRALQNGEIQRLGEDYPRRVDVRIIAATNRDLRQGVRDGLFRADLYHRLSVYPLPIPPLRERGDDVLLIAGRFLELNRARLGLRSLRLAPEAELAMRRYPWPGNVRELEHVISRAALKAVSRGARRHDIVTLDAGLLDLDGADPQIRSVVASQASGEAMLSSHPSPTSASLREQVDSTQRAAIQQALSDADGNWRLAATRLGVDGSNLHKLARRLGLK